MKKIINCFLIHVFLMFNVVPSSYSDTIYLSDNRVIEGNVVGTEGASVWIVTKEQKTLGIVRDRIKFIEQMNPDTGIMQVMRVNENGELVPDQEIHATQKNNEDKMNKIDIKSADDGTLSEGSSNHIINISDKNQITEEMTEKDIDKLLELDIDHLREAFIDARRQKKYKLEEMLRKELDRRLRTELVGLEAISSDEETEINDHKSVGSKSDSEEIKKLLQEQKKEYENKLVLEIESKRQAFEILLLEQKKQLEEETRRRYLEELDDEKNRIIQDERAAYEKQVNIKIDQVSEELRIKYENDNKKLRDEITLHYQNMLEELRIQNEKLVKQAQILNDKKDDTTLIRQSARDELEKKTRLRLQNEIARIQKEVVAQERKRQESEIEKMKKEFNSNQIQSSQEIESRLKEEFQLQILSLKEQAELEKKELVEHYSSETRKKIESLKTSHVTNMDREMRNLKEALEKQYHEMLLKGVEEARVELDQKYAEKLQLEKSAFEKDANYRHTRDIESIRKDYEIELKKTEAEYGGEKEMLRRQYQMEYNRSLNEELKIKENEMENQLKHQMSVLQLAYDRKLLEEKNRIHDEENMAYQLRLKKEIDSVRKKEAGKHEQQINELKSLGSNNDIQTKELFEEKMRIAVDQARQQEKESAKNEIEQIKNNTRNNLRNEYEQESEALLTKQRIEYEEKISRLSSEAQLNSENLLKKQEESLRLGFEKQQKEFKEHLKLEYENLLQENIQLNREVLESNYQKKIRNALENIKKEFELEKEQLYLKTRENIKSSVAKETEKIKAVEKEKMRSELLEQQSHVLRDEMKDLEKSLKEESEQIRQSERERYEEMLEAERASMRQHEFIAEHMIRAQFMEEGESWESAVEQYQLILDMLPEHNEAMEGARRVAKKIRQNKQNKIEGLLVLAEAKKKSGDWKAAYQLYTRILDLESSHAYAREQQIELEKTLGGQEAIDAIGLAFKEKTDIIKYIARGSVNQLREMKTNKMPAKGPRLLFYKSQKLDSDASNHVETLMMQSYRKLENNEDEEAIRLCEEVIKLDPENARAYDLLAKIGKHKQIRNLHEKARQMRKEEKPETMANIYQEILNLDPEDQAAKNWLLKSASSGLINDQRAVQEIYQPAINMVLKRKTDKMGIPISQWLRAYMRSGRNVKWETIKVLDETYRVVLKSDSEDSIDEYVWIVNMSVQSVNPMNRAARHLFTL